MDLLNWGRKEIEEGEPEPRRIISPAGLRLSTILESSDKASGTTKVGSLTSKGTRRNSFERGAFRLPDDDRSSQDTWTNGYTYNIYSEKQPGSPRLPPRIEAKGFFARRGGWRRLLLIALLFLVVVIAIAIGLAVGLRKQGASSSSSQNANSASDSGASSTSSGSTSGSGTSKPDPNSNATTNANFPVGSYSVEAFLDTVQSNCTSNAATWRCYPYTIYNDSPTKSLSVFNWVISADPKNKSSYVISSTDNPFAISFASSPLTLEGQGTATERYTFRTSMSKIVIPSTSITSDNSATTCFFNSTNFQGMLYTKMAKTYDPTSLGISRTQAGASYQDWPFAVRAEQVSSGGTGTPDCYKTVNGVIGDSVSITPEDTGSLCSCLYRNWLTPSPYT